MMTSNEQRRRNVRTHHWVTLDGENYSCNDCDTKTGNEPCPGQTPVTDAVAGLYKKARLATKAEREADQLTETGCAHYDIDGVTCKGYGEERTR